MEMPLLVSLKLAMSGQFALDNWGSEGDDKDTMEDIVQLNGNIALVAALFFACIFPIAMQEPQPTRDK